MNKINKLGFMLDCSRNAVMRADEVLKLIDLLHSLNYDYLELYTEDTLVVKELPYYGHLRGGYSQQEIIEIDEYASSKGIELVPCIQTLAHFTTLFKWSVFHSIRDNGDILLADDDKTYEFLEKIISHISKTFKSKKINIGMDEAFLLGAGAFRRKNGFVPPIEIFFRHLKKVKNICKNHGLELYIWSDMLFSAYNDGEYWIDKSVVFPDEAKKALEGVNLIYWDYYHEDEQTYSAMFKSHKDLTDNVTFAVGVWSWAGITAHNSAAVRTMIPGFKQAKLCGCNDVLVTAWRDDGAECSVYSALGGIIIAGFLKTNDYNQAELEKYCKIKTGYSFQEILLLDMPDEPNLKVSKVVNPSKYLLYQDPLLGMFNNHITKDYSLFYKNCAAKLSEKAKIKGLLKSHYNFYALLCGVLELKCDLPNRVRKAYFDKDENALSSIVFKDIPEIKKRIAIFYESYKALWLNENKAFGFEVIDIRIGATEKRLDYAACVIKQYLKGNVPIIEELENKVLDYSEIHLNDRNEPSICSGYWKDIVSGNVI